MSKYASYLKEREDLDMYENKNGFITYCFYPELQVLYLAELYVIPEKRGTAAAYRLFQKACATAKSNGYYSILGSVDTTTKNYELSENLMKKCGFTFYKTVANLTYYILKI